MTATVTDSISETASQVYTLTVNAGPDFTVAASPASQTVTRGGKTTYTVTVGSLNGFAGPVSLSVTGLPAKTASSFSTNPVTPPANLTKTSTLTVTTNSKGGTGTFTLTIKGSSSSVSHTTTVSLTVSH